MEANFQKIIDKISEAFSFFDFSFFVSGVATYGISCYFLWKLKELDPFQSITINVLLSIIFSYLCGVISFSCGKWIRLKCFEIRKYNWIQKFLKSPDSFAECFDKAIIYANKRPGVALTCNNLTEPEKKYYYTEMWSYLRNKSDAKDTVTFLNRYWVMQAVCEGLIFSSIIAFTGGITIYWILEQDITFLFISGIALLAFFILNREGRRYAETQILEVVIAYKHFS